MTLGELLVLSFLAFNPRPVCTERYPQGFVVDKPSCPPGNLGNDSGLYNDGTGTRECARRFRI